MFHWLFEGRISVFIVLAAVALVLLAIWWRERKRGLLIAAGVVVILLLLYWLLTFLPTEVKADRAEISRRLEEMAGAVSRRDAGPFERSISEAFHSPQGRDKKEIIQLAKGQGVQVTISQIEFPSAPLRSEGTTKVNFMADAIDRRFRVETVFEWDAGHGWRLRELHILPPIGEEWRNY